MKVSGKYTQIGTKTVDEKRRITLGETAQAGYRVKIYKNETDGTFLLVPLVEIPEREMWLYQNKKALGSVLRGIKQAGEGRGRKLDMGPSRAK
ncbi:MAG: hypothetical protein HZC17_02240 [Candidatus Omnitrophica bacterium]|nr:hypothetical protein [Candidatus Omnitrophota bacterium]